MSFDPFGQHPESQPPKSPGPPPGGPPPGGPVQPPGWQGVPPPGWQVQQPDYPKPPIASARERVQLPAMFLIALGAMNLLWALLFLFVGFTYAMIPPEKVEELLAKDRADMLGQLKASGMTVKQVLQIYTYGGIGGGAVAFLAGMLGILGGACMFAQRYYGLAVFASVVTAVPCVSPMSCPCLFIGFVVGVWCLTVLLNADVRMSFR